MAWDAQLTHDTVHACIDAPINDADDIIEQRRLEQPALQIRCRTWLGSQGTEPQVEKEGNADGVGRVRREKSVLEVGCAHDEPCDGGGVWPGDAEGVLGYARYVHPNCEDVDQSTAKARIAHPKGHGKEDEKEGVGAEEGSVDKVAVQSGRPNEVLQGVSDPCCCQRRLGSSPGAAQARATPTAGS